MKSIICLAVLMACSVLVRADGEGAWVLTNNTHGIKTYQSTKPGSNLLRLKGITVIDSRMENFGQVLRDLGAYPQWMDMCEQASLVSKIDENNMTLHILMDFPVVSNRDLVVKADTVYDLSKARGLVSLNMVKDSPVPVLKQTQRMNDFSGIFQFEYITREKTGVIYSYSCDPGGYLPAFAVNMVGKYMIYRTLKNMEAMVKKDKYVQAGLQSKDRVLFENILRDQAKVRNILKARLLEHCRDQDMVDRVVSDQNIVDLLIKGDGQLVQQLFFSWGSRESLEKVLRTVLLIHARQYSTDKKTVEKIANNKVLIDTIIEGKKPGQPSSLGIIKSIQNT